MTPSISKTYFDPFHIGEVKLLAFSDRILVRITRDSKVQGIDFRYTDEGDANCACSFAQDFLDEFFQGNIAYNPVPINGSVFSVMKIDKDQLIFG